MLLKQPGKLIVQSYTSVQYLPTGICGHGKLQMHLKVRTPAPCWLLGLSVAVRVILAHFFSAASQTFGICFRQASGLSGHGAEMERLLPDRAPTLWMGFLLSGCSRNTAVNEVYLPCLYLLLHHQVRSDWEVGMGGLVVLLPTREIGADDLLSSTGSSNSTRRKRLGLSSFIRLQLETSGKKETTRF